MPLRAERDHGVRRGQDRRDRAVVLLELDDRGAREPLGELQDVAHRGGAEPVDRLRVVADDGEVLRRVRWAHAVQDVGLQRVGVLVLVDQDVVEHAGERCAGRLTACEGLPEQQQVVVVQHVLPALAGGVGGEDLADAVDLVEAPWVVVLQYVGERIAGVHGAGVDRGERLLAWEPPFARAEPQLVTEQVHDVGAVGLIQHREVRTKAQRAAVQAQQSVRDGVEGAAPHTPGVGRLGDALGPRQHLASGAPTEGEEQEPFGAHTLGQQPGDPGRERRGLARAGAGDDQQRTVAVRRGRPLGVVEIRPEHVFGSVYL